jgi:hypothetical protein
MAPATAQVCPSGMGDVLPPPVSASSTRVYYRDGSTAIRSVAPGGGQIVDATTVPGSTAEVSSFAVSPDDNRIAVVVEDGSNPSTIRLRLYVEDLHGGGHHADIYSSSTAVGKGAMTLWPMGWHGTELVLAVVNACTFEPVPAPSAWHVADSATAVRVATVNGTNCTLDWWPSPSGILCVDSLTRNQAFGYDWTGALREIVPVHPADYQGGISPSGHAVFIVQSGTGLGAPPASSRLESVVPGVSVAVQGQGACLWIDDSTVLARDAVIGYPSGAVTPLPSSGQCAGRFPGGL